MPVTAFDTETHLIKAGCLTPRLVCGSFTESSERGAALLLTRDDSIRHFRKLLDTKAEIVGHNVAYDLAVFCAADASLIVPAFEILESRMVHDTQLRQMMIDNANGKLMFTTTAEGKKVKSSFSLQALTLRHTGTFIPKGADSFRMRYHELDGVPIEEWPAEAREYAEKDSEFTLAVFKAQEADSQYLEQEYTETQAAFALHLASCWGMRTDPAWVKEFHRKISKEYEEQVLIAKADGFIREDGTKDMAIIRAAVSKAFEGKPRQTEKGSISTDNETLSSSGHTGLQAVADAAGLQKLLTTYYPVLKAGTERPINPRYNPILETYRTSCREPNIQNLPRKGGVRECFVPREGWTYVFCDYDTLEMRSLAQVCLDLFGYSDMAVALKEGKDLHLLMAAELASCTYEEAEADYKDGEPRIAEMRQHSKPANFGFPGGMGAEKFVAYAKQYGIELTLDQAKALKHTFLTLYSEMRKYFEFCSNLIDKDTATQIRFVGSKHYRGDVMYTAVCNGFFQHLAAMGAKQAFWKVSKACYAEPESPLYGCRPVLFLHDEIGMEVPYTGKRASDAADELARVMIATMAEWIPDVPISCGPVMMRRWYKGARAVRQNGLLVPSCPMYEGGKTSWVADL
jgi:DNA polymerase I-like protein with 3'-5' exonuclease and polymerase domains